MFKESYRNKNDRMHVRESLLDEIKAAEAVQRRAEREKRVRRKQWWIAIPTAAAAVAACVALVIGLRGTKDRAKAANMEAEANAALGAYEKVDAAAYEAKQDAAFAEEPKTIETASSYDEIAEIMRARSSALFYGGDEKGGIVMAEEAEVPADAAMPDAMPMPTGAPLLTESNGVKSVNNSSDGLSYSGTNNQVVGVDEADIVKTDGTWIYVLSNSQNKVYILAADGKDTKIVSTIKLKMPKGNDTFWQNYSEMMLYGDRLYLLGSYYEWNKDGYGTDSQYTFAKVYDLGDRSAPKEIATLKQQGNYRTARLIDNLLVIVSDYRVYSILFDEVKPIEYCPTIVTNGSEKTLQPGDIYVNPNSKENGFTVITTINAADGSAYDSNKAVLGGCDTVYCSGTDLLIGSQEWRNEQSDEQTDKNGKHFVRRTSGTDTNLFRFTIDNGQIEAVASTKISGALLNQFSMDAYNGYFRVVVTHSENEEIIWTDGIDTYEWNNSSDCALYVLDGDLNVVGTIQELAKDERVQSVRFMGDTAYFVTFRQVDPLFAADLSDPSNPKVLSALKIPGFSAYLHPFGEGRLLGIGYDADEEHGWTENVKLSMFDISDPANVREAFKLSVKETNYTSVQFNHKAVFVDAATGTVAFPADDYYLVFRADENGFTEVGRIKLSDDDWWFSDARGLFIDDVFYVVSDSKVVMLSFGTMEKLGSLKLK